MSIPSFKLATGAEIPAVGLGTWRSDSGKVAEAVKVALQNGYTHLDCAFIYGNENEVGQGIKESGVNRKDIFITSKLWCTYHKRAEECLDETLKSLGTDYVDLYLIHWPIALNEKGNHPKTPTLENGERDIDYDHDVCKDTWQQMEAVLKTGKARAIGVSNWSIPKLEQLLKTAEVVPHANQVELHPYLPQDDLVKYCQSKNIIVEAYSPLGSQDSPLMKDEDVVKLAEKHNVEPATILLSYQVERGVVVLPKSVTPSRVKSNLKVIKLGEEDMKTLNAIQQRHSQRLLTPAWGKIKMGFPDWD